MGNPEQFGTQDMARLMYFLTALLPTEPSALPWGMRVGPVYRDTDLEGDAETLDTSGVSPTSTCLQAQGKKKQL